MSLCIIPTFRGPNAHPCYTCTQVVSLITIEVHARDVIERLGRSNCSSCNDFEWVSQLRFYWDKDANDCVVKQVGEAGLGLAGVCDTQCEIRKVV